MKSILVAVVCGICLHGSAQQPKVTYNALMDTKEAIPVSFKYRYGQFVPGQVYYKDGETGIGRLNFNMLVQEIHFINGQGDTMALDNLETVRLIVMGEDSFYFNKSIIEIAERYNDVMLGVKYRLSVKDRQKVGAYGMATSAGSIDTYNALRVGQGTFKLGINENVTLVRECDYVPILRDKIFLPLNMNNIVKAFPSKRGTLHQFAAENRINLKKEEDIFKLLAYCIE